MGWRRAFCTSVHRDSFSDSPLPNNNHHLHCKTSNSPPPYADKDADADTTESDPITPPVKSTTRSSAAAAAPIHSPSRFALLKAALRLSKNRCGICAESLRRNGGGGGERTVAVFTSECSHSFHFPCISAHVRSTSRLLCPVCSAAWQEVPMLSSLSAPSTPTSKSTTPRTPHKSSPSSSSAIKIYNDDESLLHLSPTKGGSAAAGAGMTQFNPIPEESETDHDDDADSLAAPAPEILTLMPESAVLVSTDRTHLSYVVSIKLKSPQSTPRAKPVSPTVPASLLDHPSCRAPIDLVTVLDVSGSMTAPKLQMLKRAMRLVVSSLGPGDRLSIVAFSAIAAKRLLPLRRMARPGQRSARQIVDKLVLCGTQQIPAAAEGQSGNYGGKSCIGDALRKATKVLEDRRERNPVATIMLLSDTHGQQQQQQPGSARSSQNHPGTRFTHLEIPINGGEEEEKQSSSSGGLNVSGLVSIVLQDVDLELALPDSYGGVISSVYSFSGELVTGITRATSHGEGGRSISLGDMYADEERQLLVEIKVPKSTFVGNRTESLSVGCSYRDPVTRDVISGRRQSVAVPTPLVPQNTTPALLRSSSSCSSSSAAASISGAALRCVFVTTRATAESRRLVDLGDVETAIHLLTSARSLLLQQAVSVMSFSKKLVGGLDAEIEELQRRQRKRQQVSPSSYRRRGEQALLAESRAREEALTPTSAWRAAEQLAKVAIMRKSMNRVSDLHGLENARF